MKDVRIEGLLLPLSLFEYVQFVSVTKERAIGIYFDSTIQNNDTWLQFNCVGRMCQQKSRRKSDAMRIRNLFTHSLDAGIADSLTSCTCSIVRHTYDTILYINDIHKTYDQIFTDMPFFDSPRCRASAIHAGIFAIDGDTRLALAF